MSTIVSASAGTGIWMAVGGIAAVLLLSAVFYAIGRGEDRERAHAARTQAERAVAADEPDDVPEVAPEAPSSRPPRPATRTRGRPRR